MNSVNNKVLLIAYEKGYRVDKNGIVLHENKILSFSYDSRGYKTFTIRHDISGKSVCRRVWVHRLQAFQKFKYKLFNNNIEVRHKNGIKSDNSLENILIGSHSDNMLDINPEIRLKKSIHASSFIKKYNHNDVIDFYSKSLSYSKTMKKFGISSKGTLNFILKKAIQAI